MGRRQMGGRELGRRQLSLEVIELGRRQLGGRYFVQLLIAMVCVRGEESQLQSVCVWNQSELCATTVH